MRNGKWKKTYIRPPSDPFLTLCRNYVCCGATFQGTEAELTKRCTRVLSALEDPSKADDIQFKVACCAIPCAGSSFTLNSSHCLPDGANGWATLSPWYHGVSECDDKQGT